ncbi:MAG: ribosome biogenesis protein [Chloroflexi bacterium]|nr:ribosome biogenesis protein [Chloroflexota bacterium]
MKTLYRCISCKNYSLKNTPCANCGAQVKHPYPARFSLYKERKFRKLYRHT